MQHQTESEYTMRTKTKAPTVAIETVASTDLAVITAPAVETAPAGPNAAELRGRARAAFAAFNNAVSLPVKPIATFKAYRPALGVLKPGMRPSPRQAAALCTAALASGQRFNSTPHADAVSFPRRFTIGADAFAIENGAASDAVSSGLASYDAETETFTVNTKQAAVIRGLLGKLAAPAFA